MIGLAALTIVVALAVIAVTVCSLGLLARVLRWLDRPSDSRPSGTDSGPGGDRGPGYPWNEGGEPAWWPEFERGLAEYVAARNRRHPDAGRLPLDDDRGP